MRSRPSDRSRRPAPVPAPRPDGGLGRAGQRARREERRRRLRRTLLVGGVLGVAVLVGLWALPKEDEPFADAAEPVAGSAPTGGRGASGGSASPSAPPSPAASSPAPSASASASTGPVPERGPGTFTAATAGGPQRGSGTAKTFRVEVEKGSGIDANEAARAVDAVLGDRRGWVREPGVAFRMVAGGGAADLVVRIATPGTADRLCSITTESLKGEANCRTGRFVVVNLRRWVEGSPQFDGPIAEYRALIVNHEVGHFLSRPHLGCAGPGQLAPAMMQQMRGLRGCKANAWPYRADGTTVRGPVVKD
ncbi:DUF3152 domain-containing protein [Streptomyces sp. BI20]|uniref:DUF3152 domain-containing protein n=1 Tax=Streptomyces sp. BI20 TaxID=3403460 RepID=UPI003C730C6C